jgi:serine/threonine protein kinase/Flp pilus assembly protein TadD
MSEREIFIAALHQRDPAERAAFLDRACGTDQALRDRVEALLREQEQLGSFLEQPAQGVERTGPFTPPPGHETTAAPAEGPGTVIGPYKLVQEIGEGGMGTVYMAQQSEPVKRLVALKLIKPGMDSKQVIARFEAERQALALMDHPHIARVLDAGTTASGRPYFVMELVKGVPLTRYCDEHRLTPRQRLELMVPVCQAVQHAHQKGIIHRDLKPSNVLVALYDGKPVPKIIDFGVAKAAGQQLTERTLVTGFGAVVGTLEYMSPEQAELNQLDVDTRSDIYSLGVLLYELLTGTTPLPKKRLKEAALLEVLRLIREEEPPRPSTRLSTTEELPSIAANRGLEPKVLGRLVRGEIDWIVMKALEKDRSHRYETANGLAMDLQRYLADEPVLACPPSAWYRFRKFARRNRGALATAGLALVFVVSLGAGAGWTVRDRAAREAALDSEVQRTLDEAGALVEGFKWLEALGAVERAEKLLEAAGRQDRPPELRELQRDLDMAQRLQAVYSQPEKEEFFQGPEQDDRYAREFARYGIDVLRLPPEQSAERIRARRIRVELVRALDFWSSRRRAARNSDPPDWKQLLEIAAAADPDPWRAPLRQALARGDRKALESLAASADIHGLPPMTLYVLGPALYEVGSTEQALVLLRRAQLRYPDDWWINNVLAYYAFTARPPRYDEALRYYAAAQAAQPRNPYNLCASGNVLLEQKAYPEAVAVFARVLELKPDYPVARWNLAFAYKELGQADKALSTCREGTRLNPASVEAHNNLGIALASQGKSDEAIAAFKEAIRLKPDSAEPHYNLGLALREKGQLDEAIAQYREAIRIKKDYPKAHCHLGACLLEKGQFRQAVEELRRGHELGTRTPRWPYPSAQWLRGAERLAVLDARLPALLKGEAQPADAAERRELASLCQRYKQLNAAAARWYGEAFAARPALADDLDSGDRYNAACAAALAGCGQGQDAARLGDTERARLRQQALEWLQAELSARRSQLTGGRPRAADQARQMLEHALADSDFGGVRGSEALARLPEAERQSRQRLWAAVAEALARGPGKAPPEMK